MPVLLFSELDGWLAPVAAALLVPMGVYILLSGLDDLALDLLWVRRLLRKKAGVPTERMTQPQPRMAVMIPLWQESGVIRGMLDHNLSTIDYPDYEFFVGVYRNDPPTREAVMEAVRKHARVHIAEVPHDGPTCKADCLNWVYQQIQYFEESRGVRFDVIVVHDAEDLIHPKSFRAMVRGLREADMVQMPVLALPTPARELTHGVYCDDFAESQTKDLLTRVELGAFLPGCGVGTAFRREALELLADADANQIFSPNSLTEDYDNGLRLRQFGCRQMMMPVEWVDGAPVATREYFPRSLETAVRQRSRWVAGNALQAWERVGWGRRMPKRWVQIWFLWRDRKGLWGNPISLACNALLVYGALSWGWSEWEGRPWLLRELALGSWWFEALMAANWALLAERMAVKMAVSGRVYGWRMACLVPVRSVWGNWINFRATTKAVRMYAMSKIRKQPLRWLKTEHAYPSRAALLEHKRQLTDILTGNGWIAAEAIDLARGRMAAGERLGELLVRDGLITEDQLYQALSIQHDLPVARLEPEEAQSRLVRAIPEEIVRAQEVVPFRVEGGTLHVASPAPPTEEVQQLIQRFTKLPVRFHLTPRSVFEVWQRRVFG